MAFACATTLVCRRCNTILANHAGGAALVSFEHRTFILTNLVSVRCSCGNQFNVKPREHFALPEDWKQRAVRVPCPTGGCKATVCHRVGELVIVPFRNRVYVGTGLVLFDCESCRCRYEVGNGLPSVPALPVAAVAPAVGVAQVQ